MSIVRRLLLGIGLALLVGGWGTTKFAEEQQRSRIVTPSLAGKDSSTWPGMMWGSSYYRPSPMLQSGESGWNDAFVLPASSGIYASGVLMMAIGALFFGFALPRRNRPRVALPEESTTL